MAEVTRKPRSRVHFAVRFAAGALRVAAVLSVAAAAGGTFALANLSQIPGAEGIVLIPLAVAVIGGVLVTGAVVSALILWGFADGLILLADLDDAQRLVQGQVTDLILETRTARGPFHSEAVAVKRPDGEGLLSAAPSTSR